MGSDPFSSERSCRRPAMSKPERHALRVSRPCLGTNVPSPSSEKTTVTRVPSIASAFARVNSTTQELTGRQEQNGIDPTLNFERLPFVKSQRHFERASSINSPRLKRGSSIATCVSCILHPFMRPEAMDLPSMIHRTPSMEMLDDFQKLEVKGSALASFRP